MKKNKLGITEGEAYISCGYRVDVDRCDSFSGICDMYDWMEEAEKEANASLIADAFNTSNKCGLLPSELLEQNTLLLVSLTELWSHVKLNNEKAWNGEYDKLSLFGKVNSCLNTINQIEQ